MRKYKKYLLFLLALLTLFIDQITKSIAINNLNLFQSVEVIKNFFYFTLAYNTGGAWSIFSNHTFVLAVLGLIVASIMVFMMIKSNSNFYVLSSSIFLGGVLGNLIDRFRQGKVTDFLDFKIFSYDFPIFNFADIFITFGVILMSISILGEEKNVRN